MVLVVGLLLPLVCVGVVKGQGLTPEEVKEWFENFFSTTTTTTRNFMEEIQAKAAETALHKMKSIDDNKPDDMLRMDDSTFGKSRPVKPTPSPYQHTKPCPPDLRAKCPLGWIEDNRYKRCRPPKGYTGACLELDFFTNVEPSARLDQIKETAKYCDVTLVCQKCRTQALACPMYYEASGDVLDQVCVPGRGYAGSCGEVRFSGWNEWLREAWAYKCGVHWPCI